MSEEYQKITIPEYLEYQKLKQENARLREALVEASEYARCDDVNGEAGSICLKALEKSE